MRKKDISPGRLMLNDFPYDAVTDLYSTLLGMTRIVKHFTVEIDRARPLSRC